MGKLIVFEGLDGSGKATQADLLCNYLNQKGENAIKITFPNYNSPSSSLVKMYLNGEFGKNVNDVNAYAASSFYSVDRYAAYKTEWGTLYNNGATIIADRYTTSNAVHQCSKLPKKEWDKYLNWLFEFEYNFIQIPKPDKVIYLDVEPSISQDLMTKRYNGDEIKKDIHEKDVQYLLNSYESAMYCLNKYGWEHIVCTNNSSMRSISDIHKDVLKIFSII